MSQQEQVPDILLLPSVASGRLQQRHALNCEKFLLHVTCSRLRPRSRTEFSRQTTPPTLESRKSCQSVKSLLGILQILNPTPENPPQLFMNSEPLSWAALQGSRPHRRALVRRQALQGLGFEALKVLRKPSP